MSDIVWKYGPLHETITCTWYKNTLVKGKQCCVTLKRKDITFGRGYLFPFLSLLYPARKVSLFHETVSRKEPIEEVCLFSNATR